MKKLLAFVLAGVGTLLASESRACTIPVFRYALEKWDLTPVELLVFYDSPLPKELDAELTKLAEAPGRLNLEITRVDLKGKIAPKLQKIWQREGKNAKGPWMLVRFAGMEPTEPSAWNGPCTSANLASLIDSPVRQAILAHLSRSSVVFLLMTSDDRKADEAAFALLKKDLPALEKKIKIPEQNDSVKLRLPLPLKVSLPVLVLDRNRPEEAGFIKLLLGTEERLADMKGPIVFPIFGRGRVLGSLCDAKKEVTSEQLMEVTKFLCRECSCQIKDLNPGIDTLMQADWTKMFDRLFDGKEPMPMPKVMPTELPKVERQGLHAPILNSEPEALAKWKLPTSLTLQARTDY